MLVIFCTGLVLFAYRQTRTYTQWNPLNYEVVAVDIGNNMNVARNELTVHTDGAYFFMMTVGATDGITVNYTLNMRNRRAEPATYDWVSLVRNHINTVGDDTMSRNALAYLGAGTQVDIKSSYAVHSSDSGKFTSLSGFAITDFMAPSRHYFMVALTSGSISAGHNVTFNVVKSNQGEGFKVSSNKYVCPIDGVYVFSLSAFINLKQTVNVEIRHGLRRYELRRTHTSHSTGGDTLSRTVLINCYIGQEVYVHVQSGIVSGEANFGTSFMGFLYNPYTSRATRRAWFVSSSVAISNQFNRPNMFPFTDRLLDINMKNIPSSNIMKVECPESGIYFITFSLMAAPNKKLDAVISSSNIELAGLKRDWHWHGTGSDTLSRDMLVECHKDTALSIQLKPNSHVTGGSSTSRNVISSSFGGFLLYKL